VHIDPNTVLISAGIDSCYGHPDAAAVKVYQAIAKHVFATNIENGICLLTRRVGEDYDTQLVRHVAA
jgi:beta-lactamase superfamily II metal-dependent hydrolase